MSRTSSLAAFAAAVALCACRPMTPAEVDADAQRFCDRLGVCGDDGECSPAELEACIDVVDAMIRESCGGANGCGR